MSKRPEHEQPQPNRTAPPSYRQTVEAVKPAPKPKRRVTTRERLRNLSKMPTIGGMREQLSHVLRAGLWVFVAIFLIGGIWSFGNPPETDSQGQEVKRSVDPVIQVGKAKLTQAKWQEMQQQMGLLEDRMLTMRHGQQGSIADSWIRQQVELRLAKAKGVSVSGADIAADIKKKVDEAMKSERGGMSDKQWRYKMQKEQGGLAKKQEEITAKLKKNEDAIRDQLVLEKLRKSVQGEVKLTDKDYAEALDEVGGRIILMRTSAVKPSPLGEGQTESEDMKKQRAENEKKWRTELDKKKADAEKVLAQLKAEPAKFAEIAKAKSEDPSKDKGGEMAPTKRESARFGDDFKKKAFETKVGEISPLIEGDEGWVIFKCEQVKSFPKDFAKVDPRSFEDAEKIAADLVTKLKAGGDFAALAKEKSDDPGSKVKGGDLDWVSRGMMVKPFEKMAFALAKDEISAPFRSQFGVHIVQVTDRELPKAGEKLDEPEDPKPDPEDKKAVAEAEALKKLPLPKTEAPKAKRVKVRHILIKAEDSTQKIEDMKKQVLDRKQSEHYEKVVKEARAKAQSGGLVVINDPQVKAYFAAQDSKPDQEMAGLQDAVQSWPTMRPDARFELARKFEQAAMMGAMGPDAEGDQQEAIKALAKDTEAAPGLIEALDSFLPAIRTALCNTLGDMKSQAAVKRLSEIVQTDSDDTVAKAAEAALTKIGAKVPERKRGSALPSLTPGNPQAPATPPPPQAAPAAP
ncbi:MAG: peptidylprolyl isomerase [Armatimonadetes bacterium]|nr:peptidylprolyl isomerase [Armatimonadota bacterium]